MTVDGDGEETPDLRRSVARQRWSIMFLAKAGDTESLNKAKKEKLQVTSISRSRSTENWDRI